MQRWRNAALVVACGGLLMGSVTVESASAAATKSFLEGAYVGAANGSGIASFGSETKTSPTIASDAIPYSGGWRDLDGADESLNFLFKDGWTSTPYTLSLAVPMIPTTINGVAIATLAKGAAGDYDHYFVTLAKTLVTAREAHSYLRLGWEFDGGAFAWSATTPAAEANFATYFAHIVTAMRSVRGEHFRFVWNPTATAFTDGYDLALAYPGNSFVDEIGLDDYDQTWVSPQTPATEWTKTTLPNLTAAHKFAAAKGKPIAVSEWGLSIRTDGHGLGDDPLFVNDFIKWMKKPAHDVAYESYFNFDVSGQKDSITEGDTPKSLAAFAADLGH